MKYMGCVTDKSFSHALLEQYPNRKPNSADSAMRFTITRKHRDLPELATKSCRHEARRCQDIPVMRSTMINNVLTWRKKYEKVMHDNTR